MSIRDPKNVRSRGGRIILPNEARIDDIAARQVAEEQAVENHPVFKLIQNMRKELVGEMARVSEQNRQITSRMHALFDYLNSLGLLAWHGVDPVTGRVKTENPIVFEKDSLHMLESLGVVLNLEAHAPIRGFDAFMEAHLELSQMILYLNMEHRHKNVPMKEIIERAREFNNTPGRLRKIVGEQIGLVAYLNENPDKLPDEEMDALAAEFQLKKEEDGNDVGEIRAEGGGAEVSQEESTAASTAVPVEGGTGEPQAHSL